MSAIIHEMNANAARFDAARLDHPETFWRLADEFRPLLLGVAARIVGPNLTPKLDASDVVQQALLAAFARRAQFQGHDAGQWQNWVLAIVRNQARKALRHWGQERRDVRREQPLLVESENEQPLPAEGSSPSHQEARREEANRLLAALQRLTPDHQQVLQLRTFEDLPLGEVAVRMNRSVEAVRKLWTRAVRSLREELGDEP